MMNLIRKNILGLKPYSIIRRNSMIKMDANESPFNLPSSAMEEILRGLKNIDFNYYPDPDCGDLKKAISDYCGIGTNHIAVGNGSDELLHLLINLFIDAGDGVLIPVPTFEMYKIYVQIAGGVLHEFLLNSEDFSFNVEDFINKVKEINPKMIILCNPNNPTGGVIPQEYIEKILQNFNGAVLIDEAYFEFFGFSSLYLVKNYPNLIILRTCSKAMGLAGLRVGYVIANPGIIDCINRIRSPYNVNVLSQYIATYILKNTDLIFDRIAYIKEQRELMQNTLKEIPNLKVFESFSNFILLKIQNVEDVYQRLLQEGFLVRIFKSDLLKDCIRVTVSTSENNILFLKTLRGIMEELKDEKLGNGKKNKGNFG